MLRTAQSGVRILLGQKIFLFFQTSSLVLRLTQPPIQWVPGVLSRGFSGRGAKVTNLLILVPTLTLILPRSRTGTVWFYTSTSNKRAARPKLYTTSLTRDLKLMYSRFTPVRISINLNSSQLNTPPVRISINLNSSQLNTPRCCRPLAGNIVGCALHHKL